MKLWSTLSKFGPFAIVVGYLVMYATQKKAGIAQILPDLQAMSLAKIQEKWQNLAMAALGAVGIYIVSRVKLPQAFRTLILMALYFFIGWQLATFTDPPEGGARGYSPRAVFRSPAKLNPYRPG